MTRWSRGQISTRLSRVLAAGWSRCRQRCSTCSATTLKLRRSRRTAAQLWVDEGWIYRDWSSLNPTDWDRAARGRVADSTTRATPLGPVLLLGVHERTIMSVLGWSTTAMVSRYAHVVAPNSQRRGESARLAALVEPNSAKNDRNVAR